MNKVIFIFFVIFGNQLAFGQPNCKLLQDSLCVKACEFSIEAAKYQGSRHSQELFDQAIELCPSFPYAYFEKSVPYLKQGMFKEWKELMNKAIQYDPSYLLQRGCNQIQFIRNYEEGVKDLDKLVKLRKTINIGYSPSGEYHAQLLRAISYQKLGNLEKAIELSEELISSKNYYQGPYDFFHIGIIHLEAGNLDQSEAAFLKQNEYDEKAEIYYYLSKVFEKKKKPFKQREYLEKSKETYQKGRIMTNSFYHYIDKIFKSDIEDELNKLNGK